MKVNLGVIAGILSCGLVAVSVASSCSACDALEFPDMEQYGEGIYPTCGLVTDVDYDNLIIEVTEQNGNVFRFEVEDGDWFVNDLAAVLVKDNGTGNVDDDEVVYSRYVGWIDDEEVETWCIDSYAGIEDEYEYTDWETYEEPCYAYSVDEEFEDQSCNEIHLLLSKGEELWSYIINLLKLIWK